MSENEEMIESDSDVVKTVFVDSINNNEIDILTPFIVRDVQITQKQKIPLYANGVLKSEEELAELGLSVKQYTRLEVETKQYAEYYKLNPTLAVRVKNYVAILTQYGLDGSATSDTISAAIQADTTRTESEKSVMASFLLTLMHDIEINWNELCPGDGFTAWMVLPKLIKYLPSETV